MGPRQVHLNRRAFTGLALHPNVPPALLHYPIDSSQAETSSFAYLLGGKKWFKEMSLSLLVHACSSVSHREDHVRAGLHVDVPASICLLQFGVSRFDRQSSPL